MLQAIEFATSWDTNSRRWHKTRYVETARFDDVVNVIDECQRAVQCHAERFESVENSNATAGKRHGRWKIWMLRALYGSEIDHLWFFWIEKEIIVPEL